MSIAVIILLYLTLSFIIFIFLIFIQWQLIKYGSSKIEDGIYNDDIFTIAWGTFWAGLAGILVFFWYYQKKQSQTKTKSQIETERLITENQKLYADIKQLKTNEQKFSSTQTTLLKKLRNENEKLKIKNATLIKIKYSKQLKFNQKKFNKQSKKT